MRTTDDGPVRVVEVYGELDILTAPRLAEALRDDDGVDQLVLDLTNVSFMSSAGVGLLASVNRRMRRRDGCVVLVGLQPPVTRVLQISGLLETFTIGSVVEEEDGGRDGRND